ncbi:sugar ABC transporter ATP-binding protein [Conexibacter sp. CPCC 206217]|uniref:sugar ABC transporter ATP-binding protein n=1 Tax=Conexibacter sp. CPCC 206217 TaxID=3064574 RepID=UPI002715D5B1|nr:sugar ABC transporter ATP-binding protein [Conexibacter sp. CPCC 206217]MDO8210227.1 sugar ABC transporter ATP-binding protein [Conexibacter sp. CPCC 206217]
MQGVSKRFPGVQALAEVDVEIRPGETLGLAGENGSGKSTLVKILAGRYEPDAGAILVDGEPVHWGSAAAGLRAGVALVSQEVLGHPDLSVMENLFFGHMPRRRGRLDWRAARRDAVALLERLRLDVEPERRLGTLALHHQHMIAIGKMASRAPRVLVLDEPTASLNLREVETVTGMVRELRDAGTAIVYITHRLEEYFELCERVVVLRDGHRVADYAVGELDEPTLIRSMVGREVAAVFQRPDKSALVRPAAPAPALAVRGLSTPRKLRDVSLSVAPGEILGIAGQAGAGRSSLCRALAGALPHSGSVELDGRTVRLRSPREAIAAGIGYVPEDRKGQGLVLGRSVQENLTMPMWSRTSRWGVRSPRREREITRTAVQRFGIRAASVDVLAGGLSGGNQQKIVLARWLARRPRVLLLDEPTRGVDVGAKEEIYRIVDELAAAGMAVVVCSSELLELLRLADRIVVMAAGRVVGEQGGDEATEESITDMAFNGLQEATTHGV